ncbi:hypothetical protein pb186bvf_016577 [Paramecium bursaria]
MRNNLFFIEQFKLDLEKQQQFSKIKFQLFPNFKTKLQGYFYPNKKKHINQQNIFIKISYVSQLEFISNSLFSILKSTKNIVYNWSF